MPEMTKYDHGVPSWVDLSTTDREKAIAFYCELFGWTSEDLGEEAGHYTMLAKDGKLVGAITPAQSPGMSYWSTYVNVDDVDAVTAKVEPAGGKIMLEPMDVMGAGRMAVYSDSTGAAIAAWQPGEHQGAQLVNEPGALTWNELATSDLARSKEFYSAVFGWGFGGSDEYSEAQVNGRTMAGVMPRPAELPAEVPDNWLVYFGVADVDSDAERATKLGAAVVAGPMDIPDTGRFVVLMDPVGAAVALFQSA